MSSISKNIRNLRIEKGLTQIQLSEMIGSTNDYISKLERGLRKNPSAKMMEKIATALSVPVNRLYEPSNKETTPQEAIEEVYRNAPKTEIPISALAVKLLIEKGLIDKNGGMSSQVQKLVMESIALQSKLENIIKKKDG